VVSFDVRPPLRALALACAIAALAAATAVAQPVAEPEIGAALPDEEDPLFQGDGAVPASVGSLPRTVEELEAEVLAVEAREGASSAALIAPLTALGLRYRENGAAVPAAAATRRALELVRYNQGLYTLDQASLLRQLIWNAESLGAHEAAWDLEQQLLRLAERNPDDARTAQILRDTADRRMDVLERYSKGEHPPEIELGCYYATPVPPERVDSAGHIVPPRPPNGMSASCRSGNRDRAKQNILYEAQTYYSQAVNIIVRNERYASDELQALLTAIIESSYRYGNPPLARRSLSYLLAYQNAIGEPLLTRIDTQVQIADWDLQYADSRERSDAALAEYEEAYRLLQEREISQESIDRIFSPAIPRSLPTMFGNPLITQEAGSVGYIDLGFEIDRYGRSSRARILDTTDNSTRAVEKNLLQLVERSRFRPKIVDGRIADSGPIVVRYYFGE
jgi:hypothetical protein